jgi:hypothetical protein
LSLVSKIYDTYFSKGGRRPSLHRILTPQEVTALIAYVLRCAENGFRLLIKALQRVAIVRRSEDLRTIAEAAAVDVEPRVDD